jgi:uncharacterized protein
MMTIPNGVLLFAAALLAGALNSVAGGGSFFSFPALIFTGVLPIPANATSTVALWPGTMASAGAYRKKIPPSPRILAPLVAASFAGGLAGASLLLHTPPKIFMHLIPFLFLAATLLFAFGKKLLRRAPHPLCDRDEASWRVIAAVSVVQFFISLYGGFFGGGMGILMLASLNLLPLGDLHSMNGVKALLASATNGIAIVAFVVAGIVVWPQAVLMLVGAAAGGYGGAHLAQKMNPERVRAFVVAAGFAMSFYFLWKYR